MRGVTLPCSIVMYRTLHEDAVLRRVRSEFKAMPGMKLTMGQAMRLWDLDRPTCGSVLESLVASQFLRQDRNGRFAKDHGRRRDGVPNRTDRSPDYVFTS